MIVTRGQIRALPEGVVFLERTFGLRRARQSLLGLCIVITTTMLRNETKQVSAPGGRLLRAVWNSGEDLPFHYAGRSARETGLLLMEGMGK